MCVLTLRSTRTRLSAARFTAPVNAGVREHMRFRAAHEQIEFEIPDPWWRAAGFSAHTPAYASSSCTQWPTTIVPVSDVEAPRRDLGVVGLHEDRTLSLLQAFRSGVSIPPLEVHVAPGQTKYRVRDGFHRYYLSIACGFSMLPVSVRPYFDVNAL